MRRQTVQYQSKSIHVHKIRERNINIVIACNTSHTSKNQKWHRRPENLTAHRRQRHPKQTKKSIPAPKSSQQRHPEQEIDTAVTAPPPNLTAPTAAPSQRNNNSKQQYRRSPKSSQHPQQRHTKQTKKKQKSMQQYRRPQNLTFSSQVHGGPPCCRS